MGFAREAAAAALEAAGGDFDEALARLASREAHAAKRPRLAAEGAEGGEGDCIELDGVQCVFRGRGELTLRLPHDPEEVGPVVGKRAGHGGGLVFDGMDEWLWELHDSHKPRVAPLPPSFSAKAVVAALDDGAPYDWDTFATADEIREAHAALEAMFARRELARGSTAWVDECAEGGHARNRRALEGQRREDACGFWDLQGGAPAPPTPILLLFRRLEAAAERLRAEHGWPLLCSRLGMAAVYDGHGACYQQHRDNEWQRHLRTRTRRRPPSKQRTASGESVGAWMNFRELTMLAYVNLPEQFGGDEVGQQAGGRLRCYVDTRRGDLTGDSAREHLDLAPVGGRAVIFRSRELLHEVLPSFARRYCLTLWICTCEDA